MTNKWEMCEPNNWHYAANVFPLLDREELEALSVDIKCHGLLNPIIRCSGKVLDGRNRVLACRLVQVEPRYRDIAIEDANTWALSQNCYRRHLKPNEEAFALHSLEIISGNKLDNIRGKDRERAYKKLAKLKQDLALLAEVLPMDAAKRLRQLLGTKKAKKEVSNFETLFHKLNVLVPAYSDGVEHVVVELLEEVCSTPKENRTPADEDFLLSIVPLLDNISKNFTAYAKRLRG